MLKRHHQGICLLLFISLISCGKQSFRAGNNSDRDTPRKQIEDDIPSPLDGTDIDSPEELSLHCQSEEVELKSLSQELFFPARQGCSWNQGENLAPINQFLQAHEKTSQTIAIPDGAVLCDMDLKSADNTLMHYDDFLFLTIEDKIIFGSNQEVLGKLPQQDDMFLWDFASIAGQPVQDFEAPYYCIGGAFSCILPPHDQEGPIKISVDSESIAPLAFEEAGKTGLQVDLIVTGDDNSSDCRHSNLLFKMEASYYLP